MWTCHGAHARLVTPELTLAADLGKPQDGLRDITVHWLDAPSPLQCASLLGVRFSRESLSLLSHLADSWVRGDDLVAVYAETAERAVRPEIYWRSLHRTAEVASFGMELIISTQTALLDAPASMIASSELTATELVWLPDSERLETAQPVPLGRAAHSFAAGQGHGIVVCRLDGVPFSYIEMVYPSDLSVATLSWSEGKASLQWQLFPESIEKGVIRRARLRGLFVDRTNDLAEAARQFATFAASSLPLTT